eukprot:gene64051-87605_t
MLAGPSSSILSPLSFPLSSASTRLSKDFVDPFIVWTQIKSYLKGSLEAALLGRSLKLEEYLDLESFGENRCRLSKEMRVKAFRIFEQYENDLKDNNMWDDCDRIMNLLKKHDLDGTGRTLA